MLRRPFPDATLEALRTIGDPRLADQRIGDVGSYFSDVAVSGLDVALANSGVRDIVMVEAQHDFDEALAMLESFGIEPTQAIARGAGCSRSTATRSPRRCCWPGYRIRTPPSGALACWLRMAISCGRSRGAFAKRRCS